MDFVLSSFLASILAVSPSVYALPVGGVVTSGNGAISQSGAVTTINQSSARLGLAWNSFNIGAAETVNFVQPSSSSIAVNRIHDVNGTQILGKLNANGQVFLINPNGILFGAGSQVNVGGLVASALDLGADGKTFRGAGGSVVNQGALTAADGGYIALLGGSVSNQGVITARLGTVALGAGNQVTLDFSGDQLVSLTVDNNAVSALAENKQLIRADGGVVIMSAGARDSLVASVVNNTGVVQAQTIENRGGRILLLGGMKAGTTTVAGTLDASAPVTGDGGFIETSAAHVTVAPGAKITTRAASGRTGTWLLDPVDYTIAASGGDITGTALSVQLADNNVVLEAAGGNLNVNDTVAWIADTTLTLTALGSIVFNAPLTAIGDHAGLVLSYGTGADHTLNGHAITLSGATPTLQIGETGSLVTYTVINSLGAEGSITGTDLQGINGDPTGHYALGSDIDASATADWNAGAGFNPLGAFTGTFTGLGHTLTGLTINRPSSNNIGLFGQVFGGLVRDVGLVDVSIKGGTHYVGGLVGFNNFGTITNVSVTGAVSGILEVGGLVGYNSGTITDSRATGAVSGASAVGGLVGYYTTGAITNAYATGAVLGYINVGGLVGYSGGTITDSYATGAVSGGSAVGGLVGANTFGTITHSYSTGAVLGDVTSSDTMGGLVGTNNSGTITAAYATGAVSGQNRVGGLVGGNNHGTITNAYATGAVSGQIGVGGLVGRNSSGGTITGAYAMGAVSGQSEVGGLVGSNSFSSLTNVYATGAVSGNSSLGGLVGANSMGTITAGYWDMDTTGQSAGVGSGDAAVTTGLTASDAFTQSNYAGLDFDTTWFMVDGNTRPVLRSEYSTTITNAHQLQLMALDLTASYTLANNIDASETAGTNPSGMWTTAGFSPVGPLDPTAGPEDTTLYTGTFDGLGHTITGLTINRPSQTYVGLFGALGTGGVVRNIGLVGDSVTGQTFVGGLVGLNYSGLVVNAYATGAVWSGNNAGGLVGGNGGTITNSYATGAVSGNDNVGGLVGFNDATGTITNTYATGAVTANDSFAGGLVGFNYGTITNVYATGAVTGANALGGLVGGNAQSGTITAGYWDMDSTGIGSDGASGTTGLTTAQSLSQSSYVGFDFDTVWFIGEGATQPFFRSEYSTTIGNFHQLLLMGSNLTASYTLAGDLDLTGTANFTPVGGYDNPFTGSFEGLGHTIIGLTIYKPNQDAVGLFGAIGSGSVVKNISLVDAVITGNYYVGGLVGSNNGGTITNAYATTSTVTGDSYVGGLVGYHISGAITNASFTGTVTGGRFVGGLVGYNDSSGTITNAYSAGSVSCSTAHGYETGGLVGYNLGTITNAYSTAAVASSGYAADSIGGLIGRSEGGAISNVYSSGSVTVTGDYTTNVGGLAGYLDSTTVTNAYSTASVTTGGLTYTVGGFAGFVFQSTISNAYSTGVLSVNGSTYKIAGFIGNNNGSTITAGYWDKETTGQSEGVGDGDTTGTTGLTTSEAFTQSNYTGFDFDNTWFMLDGNTRPFLRSEYSTTISNAHQLQLMALDLTAHYTLADNIDASATAGTHASGMWTTAGFSPVGTDAGSFAGTFNGLGHTVSGLVINRPAQDFVGLFGDITTGAVVENVGLVDVTINGGSIVGALVGHNVGTITNAYASGSFTGTSNYLGGLVGYNAGTITNAYATGAVSGNGAVGGLVGQNNGGTITNAYATGAVSGIGGVGGLVGLNYGTITAGYWDMDTTGQSAGVGSGSATGTTGLTTSEAFTQASYAGFDCANTWFMVDGQTRPFLRMEYSTTITNDHQLQLMAMDLSAHYTLANNIDASDTVGTGAHASGMWTTTGFVPVGDGIVAFTGSLNGQKYTINDLTINQPSALYVGLFGKIGDGGLVKDVGLVDVAIMGQKLIGGLAGNNAGTITNAYVTGSVSGTSDYIGGLVGYNAGTITNAYSTAAVASSGFAADGIGGLIGNSAGGTISTVYSSGSVTTTGDYTSHVGGLVGYLDHTTVTNAYSTASVTTGSLTYTVGGFAGYVFQSTIANAYSAGVLSVNGSSYEIAGFVGHNNGGTITASYWDKDTTGQSAGIAGGNPTGVTGLTTADFQDTAGFVAMAGEAGWNFVTTWAPPSAGYYPQLYALTPVVFVQADNATSVYGDNPPTDFTTTTHGGPASYVFGPAHDTLVVGGTFGTTATSASGVGSYDITSTAGTSADSAQGIAYRVVSGGTLTVTARPIELTADDQTRHYGDENPSLTYTVTDGNIVNDDAFEEFMATTATGTTGVGGYAITQGALDNSNYAITFVEGTLSVTARPITVTANNQTGAKGKDLPALTYGVTDGNLVNDDSLNGALATTATSGSAAGDYAITQGDLSASANYELTFVDGVLTIEADLVNADLSNAIAAAQFPTQTTDFTIQTPDQDGSQNDDRLNLHVEVLPVPLTLNHL